MENKIKSPDFTIFPAIDLLGGKVVRLAQGDPKRQTVYSDDPYETVLRWQQEGAAWVHVVNLEGAFGENAAATDLALAQVLRTKIKVQYGGGLRDVSGIKRALDSGISRVVIGTAAIDNQSIIEVAMRTFGPEKIAVGIDARGDVAQTHGWKQGSKVNAIELGRKMFAMGVRWCVFTDIERDGVSTGVNIPATVVLAQQTGLRVIASGGVASLQDVENVAKAGLAGVIIGRALYEGTFTLKEALVRAG